MNDHLYGNNLPEDDLTPDELALLQDALTLVCPPPKSDLRGRVMAQIRRERAAASRRRLRNRFVKIGSLAACLALVTMVGVRVLPSLTQKSADIAAYDDAAQAVYDYTVLTDAAADGLNATVSTSEPAQTEAETVPPASNGILYSYAAPEAEEECVTECEEVFTDTSSEAPAETVPETMAELMPETTPETMAAAEDTIAETECKTAPLMLMMASGPRCSHKGVFADSYHTIPEQLIAVTGEDVYLAWDTEVSGCGRNIADYLGYMEENTMILTSDIEMLYDATDLWYQYDWNFDLLNSGDADAVEEYYRNGGDFAGMVKRATEYNFKLALLDETGAESSVSVCAWSIADLVESENITLSALTSVYEASADEIETAYPGYEAQAYDLAALHDYAFSAANDEPNPPSEIAPGRNEDAMFRVDAETLK